MNYPPVAFLFRVGIEGEVTTDSTDSRVGFQEASGISAEMSFEALQEGGQNLFQHKLPGVIKYSGPLVLKRGLILENSGFGKWFTKHFKNGLNLLSSSSKVDFKVITVSLWDITTDKPLITWSFTQCYPLKWEISGFDAKTGKIAVETLSIAYAQFERV